MSLTEKSKTVLHCSFCGKPSDEVTKLIAGPGVYICDSCVRICAGILDTGQVPDNKPSAEAQLTSWEQQSDEEILALLPRLAVVSAQVDDRVRTLVELLRGRGVAWAGIGDALGVTRQSAWERFRD